MAHDDYKQLPLPETPLELCPCCGAKAELWQYSTSETAPCTKVVMCSNGDAFGPQDGVVNGGCPLYMPPDGHYMATIREAVKYWNEYAKALTAMQRRNRWAVHSALRDAKATTSQGEGTS